MQSTVEAPTGSGSGPDPKAEAGPDSGSGVETARQPSWWHRDHPVFTSLAGFFSGLAFVAVVPTLFAGITRLFLDADEARAVYPFVLVTLIVPIGLLFSRSTRRFGRYLLLGIVVTLVVVLGVAALVLWILMKGDS